MTSTLSSSSAIPFPIDPVPSSLLDRSPIDRQRSRLYAAEQSVRPASYTSLYQEASEPLRSRMAVLGLLEDLVDRYPALRLRVFPIQPSNRFLDAPANIRRLNLDVIVTKRNRRTSRADYRRNELRLAWDWGTHPLVILHEYAHLLVRERFHVHRTQPHGPEFAGVFLLLIQLAPTTAAYADGLRGAYRTNGVRFNEYRLPTAVPAGRVMRIRTRAATATATTTSKET